MKLLCLRYSACVPLLQAHELCYNGGVPVCVLCGALEHPDCPVVRHLPERAEGCPPRPGDEQSLDHHQGGAQLTLHWQRLQSLKIFRGNFVLLIFRGNLV